MFLDLERGHFTTNMLTLLPAEYVRAFSGRTDSHVRRDRQTHRSNPRCACAPRINKQSTPRVQDALAVYRCITRLLVSPGLNFPVMNLVYGSFTTQHASIRTALAQVLRIFLISDT